MNPIQLEAKKREVIDLTIGQATFKDFTVVSKWNGMIELKNPEGLIIIAEEEDATAFSKVFGDVFGDHFKTPMKLVVIKASPEIVSQLVAAGYTNTRTNTTTQGA